MSRIFLTHGSAALCAVAALAATAPARGATFNDFLVQPPSLTPPERGSVAGAFAHLAFEPGSLDRGDLSLMISIALPSERGAPLGGILPSYSPGSGQSEWGMGWKADSAIRRFAIVGDVDMAGDEFVGPWGRLRKGDDGRYLPLGAAPMVSVHPVGGGWVATSSDGTVFTFGAGDVVAGGYAWMMSRVDGVLGESTVFSYDRNASGRPFVSAVEWGGRGSQHQYRLELGYETLAVAIDDYRAGAKLSLDRRVHDVTVKVRSTAGTFDVRWSYRLDYTTSPAGAAFYLTGVTRTFGSGAAEPTQRFEYDFGNGTVATATLTDVPALDPVLATVGGSALQPDKAGAFDVEDDGMVDFEIAKDQTLVHQSAAGFTVETLPANPGALALCRPPAATANLPRMLARMTPDAAPQVFRAVNNASAGTTRILVCDRQGVAQSDQTISGLWAPSPTVHLVDLNHDHKPDLVRMFSHGYQVVENTSDATGHHFVVHPVGTLADAFTPDSSWVQDMNGDGQGDLVMRFGSSVGVWYGLGQFQFAPNVRTFALKSVSGTTVTDLATRQLTFLDVNRDGLMDVITTKGRVLNLFVNDGHQLNEVVVPGLSSMTWDFGVPVVADVTGSGDYEVLFVQGAHAKQIKLSSPATGLLTAAHDGKGTDVRFAYKRSAPFAGFGPRMTLLDTLTVESSGYDTVSYRYDYGAPVIHSQGKHLVGFASVDRRAPVVTDHVEFVNDDDVAGLHALSETTDDRSPGIIKFVRDQYDDITFDGVRWLRPALAEAGHRSTDNLTRLSTLTQYSLYERGFCPTVTTATTPSGQLTTTTTLASVAAIPDEVHCLPASQMLFGAHADPTLDFTYLADVTRNDLGQVTRVTQIDPLGAPLVLQDVTYTTDHRVQTIGTPGRGTTTVGYDTLGRLTSLTDPVGVVTQSDSLDPLSDAPLAIQTMRPDAAVTASFHYDGRERLEASWDDVSGSSELQPLAQYSYRDPTSTTPARVDTQTLADAAGGLVRNTASLIAADGAPMVSGTWLGDHFALGSAAISVRNTLTQRSSFVGTMSGDALATLTSAQLRELGTPLHETVHAGFGHAIQATTTQQDGVAGTVTRELVLGNGELVTRIHQPGGFTAESAVDAAGKLVRQTDETGAVHRYGYDALGRLVRIDTPDGAHTLAFDGFARPTRVARDGVGAIAYAYDPVSGQLVRKQRLDTANAVVDTAVTSYDAIGRPTQVALTAQAGTDGSAVAFAYDGQVGGTTAPGQLGRTSRVSGDGWQRTELFDALGRSVHRKTTFAGWREITSDKTYRADGSVASDTITVSDAAGAVVLSFTKETELDALGRIAGLAVDGAPLYTLSYDDEGRLARADFASGEAIAFDYDAVTHRGRGHRIDGPNTSGAVHWDRDARGLIRTETVSRGTEDTHRDYTYDGRGQLTRAATGADVASYTYTASGLPDTIDDPVAARAAPRFAGKAGPGDPGDRRDSAGRVIGKGEWTFSYGANGQISRATRAGRQIDFVYDETNQRLLKRVDGAAVRAEVAGGVVTASHFVELVTVGGVVAGVLDNGQFTALLTDSRGTPLAGSDGTPSLASPYGVRAAPLPVSDVIDYARLGWDPDLDIVRMGVRDYDARLAQFLTPDPLYLENLEKCQSSPLQCALYGYALGNPVSFVDPNGEDGLTDYFVPPRPDRDRSREGVLQGESNVPQMVRDIRVDMKPYEQVGQVVEGVAEAGKTAGGFVADVTPIVGTVRAFNRHDYVGGCLSLVGDVVMVGKLAGVLLKAGTAARAISNLERGERLVVFRELSAADRVAYDAGQDLLAKGTGGTIAEHVAGQPTKYISAGEKASAIAKYSSGNGLIAIDVEAAIERGAGYVCHANVCQSIASELGRGSLEYKNASNAFEALFKNFIPREACTLIK